MGNLEIAWKMAGEYKAGGLDYTAVVLDGMEFRIGPHHDKQGWYMWECLTLQHLAAMSGSPIYSASEGLYRVILSALYFANQIGVMVENVTEMNGGLLIRAIDPYSMGGSSRVAALAWAIFNGNGGLGMADRLDTHYRAGRVVPPRIGSFTFYHATSRVLIAKWEKGQARVSSSPAIPILVDAAMEGLLRIGNSAMEDSFNAGELDPILDREEKMEDA